MTLLSATPTPLLTCTDGIVGGSGTPHAIETRAIRQGSTSEYAQRVICADILQGVDSGWNAAPVPALVWRVAAVRARALPVGTMSEKKGGSHGTA